MLLFAVLFGLSMDYQVFLLSRVREEYLRAGDNNAAIVGGVSGTARIITSAAMIMTAVFLSLVFAPDPSSKMLGLGMAPAIFVDATVVRMVLISTGNHDVARPAQLVAAPMAGPVTPAGPGGYRRRSPHRTRAHGDSRDRGTQRRRCCLLTSPRSAVTGRLGRLPDR
jgi:hypothetical protein